MPEYNQSGGKVPGNKPMHQNPTAKGNAHKSPVKDIGGGKVNGAGLGQMPPRGGDGYVSPVKDK